MPAAPEAELMLRHRVAIGVRASTLPLGAPPAMVEAVDAVADLVKETSTRVGRNGQRSPSSVGVVCVDLKVAHRDNAP